MHAERKAATFSHWRGVFRFEADKVAPWTGFRNAVVVVLVLSAGDGDGQYSLVNTETDCIVNSVNTLSGEILAR